jgi:hypothetical protein
LNARKGRRQHKGDGTVWEYARKKARERSGQGEREVSAGRVQDREKAGRWYGRARAG